MRLIVNFPAGSGTADTVARALCEYLTRKWGQPMTVDNMPGSTGVVGAESAYRAEPDGYTLLVTPAGALTVAQHLQKLYYDPAQFVPITMLETSPIVLVASPHLPVKTLPELIAYARQIRANSASPITASARARTLPPNGFASMARYRSSMSRFEDRLRRCKALNDGRVDVLFDNLGSSLQPIRNGEVKALAVASDKPEPLLPDVPTIARDLAGLRDILLARAGCAAQNAASLAKWLSAEFAEALRQPQIEKTLADLACEPVGWTPQATGAFIRNESERWKSVIREAKISLQ